MFLFFFVSYWLPLKIIDAVSATIVDGGRAILLKTQRLIKNYFSFILRVTKVFFPLPPWPTPWTGCLHIGLGRFIKSMRKGKWLCHHGRGIYCTFCGL
jgi:hypothetical protein